MKSGEEEKKEEKIEASDEKIISGVEKLGELPLPPRKTRHFFRGTILGSRLYIGDKPGGMEPGALTITIDSNLIKFLAEKGAIDAISAKSFLSSYDEEKDDPNECVEFVRNHIEPLHRLLETDKLLIYQAESKLPRMETMLKEKHKSPKDKVINDAIIERINALENAVIELRDLGMKGKIPLFLVKQYYDEKSISPPPDRLRATTRGQTMSEFKIFLWQKSKEFKSSRQNENTNAIGESFATAVARALGMTAQSQFLIIDEYENGDLRVMTDCAWTPGLSGMTGHVAGTKYLGYYVESEKVETADGKQILLPIPTREDPPYYRSTLDQLDYPAQYLAMFLVQADDDCFGSMLQNKMILGKELYGIDFGHAYRESENPLVENIDIDFNLNESILKKYKNLSMLFDSSPTDKMLGLFYLYQSMKPEELSALFPHEQKIIQESIEEYKKRYPSFANRIQKIQPGCVDKIYLDYKNALEKKLQEEQKKSLTLDLSKREKSHERIKELRKNLESLEKMYILHKKNRDELLTKFKSRMLLSPDHLTMLHNLGALTSKTRITDKGGTVLLNHLQVISDSPTLWHMRRETNIIDAKEQPAEIVLSTKTKNKAIIATIINEFIHPEKLIKIQETSDGITVRMPEENLAKFNALLNNQERIKSFKVHHAKKFPGLHETPSLVKVNQKYPGAAKLINNLTLLSSLTNITAKRNMYIMEIDDEEKNPKSEWSIKETKDGTIKLSAKITNYIEEPSIMLVVLNDTLAKYRHIDPFKSELKDVKFTIKGKMISITCEPRQLEALCSIFSLDNIRKMKEQDARLKPLVMKTPSAGATQGQILSDLKSAGDLKISIPERKAGFVSPLSSSSIDAPMSPDTSASSVSLPEPESPLASPIASFPSPALPPSASPAPDLSSPSTASPSPAASSPPTPDLSSPSPSKDDDASLPEPPISNPPPKPPF